MKDHPIIWTNPTYDRALYIGIGHDVSICTDPNFTILMRDAITWAASKVVNKEQNDLEQSLAQEITLLANQVAYNLDEPKTAMVKSNQPLSGNASFQIVNALTNQPLYDGKVGKSEQVTEWHSDLWYSRIDFSAFQQAGYFKIRVKYNDKEYESYDFKLEDNALGKIVFPAIVNFFYHQRANSPQELEADKHLKLYGSEQTVDLHGGWCDASGDISKYFSHLAYANFMSPQQIPMVTW